MDFTVIKYKELLQALADNIFSFQTFGQFQQTPGTKAIVLRHDVDLLPENSLLFAKIQAERNIVGTYYFRSVPGSWDVRIIKEISSLGHEIGYHYETMDTARGNVDKAYNEFCINLERFCKIVPVSTICMHGSPLSEFDNRDIWKKYDYKLLGLTAEPYLDLDFNRVFYLTDTGRCWNGGKFNRRDKNSKTEKSTNPDFLKRTYKSTADIIQDLNKGDFPNQVMITFHPQRWTDNKVLWAKELISQNFKNQIKRFLVK